MMKKKNRKNFERTKKFFPYILVGFLTLLITILGTIDKKSAEVNISLDTIAASDYKMSVDQLSELYIVADLSEALSLASAPDVASNYVIASTMRDVGQTSSGKLEKPNITNIVASRGVKKYTVVDGEDINAIATKFGISSDQVRWSNGLKNTDVDAGTVLYIPSVSGIVYTVKDGDTISGIVEKYGSTESEIIALNDLEVSGISEGMKILLKDGTLPEKERPEYVPPAPPAPIRTYYTYTYLGSTSVRQNIVSLGYFYGLGGPYTPGQCTQWAWSKRPDLPPFMGNAANWAAYAANSGYTVSWAPNSIPVAGSVFQTGGGWYGHVGYVEAVNEDGSIVISEMNYNYQSFHAIQSTVPANMVGIFNYIYP